MRNTINLFPTLNDGLIAKCGLGTNQPTVICKFDSDEINLDLCPLNSETGSSNRFYLDDKSGKWNEKKHPLYIGKVLFIDNPSWLFGEKGIVGINDTIGYAIEWTSKDSSQRGIFIGDDFKFGTNPLTLNVVGHFSPGQIRNKLTIKEFIYLKEKGNRNVNEIFLAQKTGSVLGELHEIEIALQGQGSIFPVYPYEGSSSEPLWNLECNWADSRDDLFIENVKLTLNTSHFAYSSLFVEVNGKSSALLTEIIAASLFLITSKVTKEISITEFEVENFDEGTVASVVKYFVDTFELNLSSDEELSYSIRKYIVKNGM